MQNSPSMSIPAEKNLLRRASGILSNITSPFANHRASFLLDTSDAISYGSEASHGDDTMMGSTPVKRSKATISNSQILVETFRQVHTSSPGKEIRYMPSHSALVIDTKSTAVPQNLLKPHSYHYQKNRAGGNISSQGYRITSQRLCSSSRSMEQLIMGEEIKGLLESSDFQAAFNGPLNLSPILDEPNSPESDADATFLFSPRQRAKSLQPYAVSSRMERGIETTSSIGYNPVEQNQSSHWKAHEEKRFSKEDYSTWIRFENPIDLLSPTFSSHMTSPSVFSNCSFENHPEKQHLGIESYSMTREETQSYIGDSPTEAQFSMHSHSDLGASSQNFGALSSAGLFIPSSNASPIPPSLTVPISETTHKSLRKKISQSLKDTFSKPKC